MLITGSVGLTPGGRYAIEVDADTFRVRGPVDIDAERIAVERPLTAMAATAFESRLVVNERARGSRGAVLAFMSLSGGTPTQIAEEIVRLADAAQVAS